MPKVFEVAPGPHSHPDHIQLAIRRRDLTLEECRYVYGVISNCYTPSQDYQLRVKAGAFLQGYQEPAPSESDGWVLVEFWTDNRQAIDAFVQYLNDGMIKRD